jgi:hypothetical protein
MIMRGLIVMGMFAASLAHGAAYDYSEVRDLAVDASGLTELEIDAGAGSLSVTGVDGATDITVVATIRVESRDEDKARSTIEKRLRLTLGRDGDRARLRSEFDSGWGWDDNAAVDLDVHMPVGVSLVIDDGSGSTVITGVKASVKVDDGSGSLEISEAGDIDVDDGSGSITIRNSTGDVYVNDGSGSIEISGVAGTVTVDDGSGSINVDDVGEDLIIEDDGSGSVSFSNVRGVVEQDD